MTELKSIKGRLERRLLETKQMDCAIQDEIKDPKLLDTEVEESLHFHDKVGYILIATEDFLEQSKEVIHQPVSTFQSSFSELSV